MTDRRATYRIQLRSEFGFAELADIAGYLAELGISHVYCSPLLQAVAGSAHGYDVVDPTRVSDDLGGEAGYRRLTEALDASGVGQLLDIVPNHMSIGERRNRWWWDVLSVGRNSPFAAFFDINWDHPLLRGRVMAPLLGDKLESVLAEQKLRLTLDGGIVFAYYEHRLPLSPETQAELLNDTPLFDAAVAVRDAEFVEDRWRYADELADRLSKAAGRTAVATALTARNQSPAALLALLERQHYALAYWKEATVVMNYRRFFDITSLVAMRVEEPAVLEASHLLIDSLLDAGCADGVRIDHVDGLRSPALYLERMRRRHPGRWLLVEKILEAGETLPEAWPVDGTTGYEFAALAGGLFIDPAGWTSLRRGWAETTGHSDDFLTIARDGKREVMETTLRPNVQRLVRLAAAVCRSRGQDDLAADAERLESGITEYLLGLDVYRTYIDGDAPPGPDDRARIDAALHVARAAGGDHDTLALLASLLDSRSGDLEEELIARMQQVSTVVMAKGVEDTAFYRFPPLTAACEVGTSPARPLCTPNQFHAANALVQSRWPQTLVATSTHDSKRSEDVRARLLLLSELAGPWQVLTRRWRQRHHGRRRQGVPGRTMEELLYQTIVGAWPIEPDRAVDYILKAAREAKQRTSWIERDGAYDAALAAFVRSLLADPDFVGDVGLFVQRLVTPGRVTSLAMTLLRLTCPGVPDTYQGTELWSLSLVDPDNRRPVDYAIRRTLLASLGDRRGAGVWAEAESGLPKLFVIRTALDLRRRRPELFDRRGEYLALTVAGSRRDHALAFARGAEPGAVTVVPRLVIGLDGDWGETAVSLPNGGWRNLLDGSLHTGAASLGGLLADFPVALLERA